MTKTKLNRYMLAGMMLLAGLGSAEARDLPAPNTTGGKPLMEMIAERHTARDIDSTKTISAQELSDMLWAAWGVTHDGKRTVATAINKQELKIYVITPTEISLYNAEANTLTTVATGDYRAVAGKQDFAKSAPVNIVIVADAAKQHKLEFQAYAAGAASQNIYLYCAQAGLKTVLRASFDHEGLAKAMKLGADEHPLFVQTVGH